MNEWLNEFHDLAWSILKWGVWLFVGGFMALIYPNSIYLSICAFCIGLAVMILCALIQTIYQKGIEDATNINDVSREQFYENNS